jgi:lipoprotein signal peptidase
MLDLNMIGIYVSAILAVIVLSAFLYKDNPLFHAAEHIAIGVALANGFVLAAKSIYDVGLSKAISGRGGTDTVLWISAVVFGGLMLVRWPRKSAWLARWPLAIIVGAGIGLGFRGAVDQQFVGQVIAGITPLIGGPYTPIDNLVMIVFTLPIIAYFIFSREMKGSYVRIVPKVARYAMMITFGAMFGGIMMTRWSYLASRLVIILQALGLL